MTAKQDALQEIVTLARTHQISAAEISHAMTDVKAVQENESGSTVSRLFGYIGGLLVFAGICIFIGNNWENINSAGRVIITLGTGFAAFLLGVFAINHSKYDRVATPLLLMAAFLQPVGMMVMLFEYSRGGDPRHGILFMAGTLLLQQSLALLGRPRTTLAFTSIFFFCAFFTQLLDIYDVEGRLTALCLSTSLMLFSWTLSQSRHRAIAGFWYFFAAGISLAVVWDYLQRTPFEPLFLGLCALYIFISTRARSRVLLLMGCIGMLSYIGYYTALYFANSNLWPLALILVGGAFIGLGALALKLNAKYIREKPQA